MPAVADGLVEMKLFVIVVRVQLARSAMLPKRNNDELISPPQAECRVYIS